jgi:S-formylglutathione hydrolase FrmB
MPSRRSRVLAFLCALAGGLLGPAVAHAEQQTLTWDLTSKYISKTDALAELHGGEILKAGPTGLRSWVVLPDGYTPDRCYPVLYLLHGSQAPAEWAPVAPLVKDLQAIVVAPGGGDSVYSNWWNGGQRQPRWEDWFFKEVMPLVNRSFNICPGRANHSIAGTSMGGYGALYLASQRPQYFGSAGSFSGIIALTSPVLQIGFGLFNPVWGPPNGFYADGHDPVVLVDNLRHTRVLVEQGNGTPFDETDVDPSILATVEQGTQAMGREFLRAARKAKIPVTYELHTGIHTPRNFNYSLTRMLAWQPFAAATENPSSWSLRTVADDGEAWGYRYRFTAPPRDLAELSLRGGVLRFQGKGRATVTTPAGKRITAKLPFAIVDGKARPIRAKTVFSNGRSSKLPVPLGLRPWHPRLGQPVEMRFRTDRKLKPDESYVITARQQLVGCYTGAYAFSRQRKKGRLVKVMLKPGIDRGHPPNRWCTGNGHVSLLIASGTSVATAKIKYVGEATFNAAKRR